MSRSPAKSYITFFYPYSLVASPGCLPKGTSLSTVVISNLTVFSNAAVGGTKQNPKSHRQSGICTARLPVICQ